MKNNKKLYIFFIYFALIQHTPTVALPDFFWIGKISRSIWNKFPSCSFSSFKFKFWLTKTEAQNMLNPHLKGMTERYGKLQKDCDIQQQGNMAHIKKATNNVKVENNEQFVQQRNNLSNLGENVDSLSSQLGKNENKIGALHKKVTVIKGMNQHATSHLATLNHNTQRTSILFKENQKEVANLTRNCVLYQKENRALKNKFFALLKVHKKLQKNCTLLTKENNIMKKDIEILKENVLAKQNHIDFLKNYIITHLHDTSINNKSYLLIKEDKQVLTEKNIMSQNYIQKNIVLI